MLASTLNVAAFEFGINPIMKALANPPIQADAAA